MDQWPRVPGEPLERFEVQLGDGSVIWATPADPPSDSPVEESPPRPYDRAIHLAEHLVTTTPLTDDQTIELAKVYALLACVDGLREGHHGVGSLVDDSAEGAGSGKEHDRE